MLLERLLPVWLVLLSALALTWERLFPGTTDPFLASKPWLSYAIAATMFAVGSLLPRDEIRQVARRWWMVAAGTAIQYTSMPLLAYCMGHLFQLDNDQMIGILMAGCVPGAMASNVLTMMARGNTSYSVSLTTLATLISPVVVPALLWLTLRQQVTFPIGKTAWELACTVVFPVVAGYTLSHVWESFGRAARHWGPLVANLTILWIIGVVVAVNRVQLAQFSLTILLALLGLNVGGYAAGYVGGLLLRIDSPMRRALTIEIGMQNAGLGTVLIFRLFPDHPAAAVPTALYTFGCMFTGTLLARVWSGFPPRDTEADREPCPEGDES